MTIGRRIDDPEVTEPPVSAAADRVLRDHVHPADWRNPPAAAAYDLVVLGGGTAGLVSAMGAAGLGARVALVERHFLGGDCLNTGCVPSKALIRSARAVGELRRAPALGVDSGPAAVDFAAVMLRMRQRRASIAEHDAADRVRRGGVDLFFGDGRFADARSIVVAGQRLGFGRAVIATGGRPAAPPIAGLEATPFHTSETIFTLTALPRRLLIIGAGPLGCELAQTFARFGSEVTLFGKAPRVLRRDDADAAAIVHRHVEAAGVRVVLGVAPDRVAHADGTFTVEWPDGDGARHSTRGEVLLVAAGRAANVEGLALDAAGITANRDGVVVTDRLQTTNRRVYAAGDVCSSYKFTHAADALARVVLQNALFFGRRKASALVIPWVTYTDPEVAHVGCSADDVAGSGGRLETISIALGEVDRAVVDDETDGFVRVHHEGGALRGCTIVAPHAGEMIGEAVYAITHGGSLAALASTVHPYPTQAEALRKAGDTYNRQRLTPGVRRWFERYFRWTR